LNSVALLGWNPPHREDVNVISQNTGVFMRSEVMTIQDMLGQFNIDKISKSGAQFDFDRLEFFN
jgi:hypothetical protein